jgi:hypothetical protein
MMRARQVVGGWWGREGRKLGWSWRDRCSRFRLRTAREDTRLAAAAADTIYIYTLYTDTIRAISRADLKTREEQYASGIPVMFCDFKVQETNVKRKVESSTS